MKGLAIISFFVMLAFSNVNAQGNADKLRKSRENTLREIEYANKLLIETQGKTKESLNEINLINHKLNKRKEYMMGIELEVNLLQKVIADNQSSAVLLQQEINRIKKVYEKMIYHSYKNRSLKYRMMYFLASENLNQLYKRVRIIKIFNGYLKSRKEKLEGLKKELLEKNRELETSKNEKEKLVNIVRRESEVITHEMVEKRRLVNQLKKKQKDIENEIREKERTARKLENELKRIIEEERRKLTASGVKDYMTPAEKIISSDFEKNEGRLPWPTERGVITGQYGEHQHPDYKSVKIRNDGIYITTSSGERVRSIFKGVVSRVFTIPGQNYTVIVKHGEFYTLYHNMIGVQVKAGQNINTKDVLGTVFTDEGTKETILYFQVWKGTEKKDPELWLAQ